jgi:HSP20 family protein|tara:strand:- start:2491 stop:2910 length:420 start_codon:yes stop_codon:yes gene_type:complete
MNLIRKQNTRFPSIMDDFFKTNWDIPIPDYSNSTPAVNVKEDDKSFTLQIAAPGVNKDDFQISYENKVMSIEVVKNNENKNDDFTRKEFDYNSFKRSFSIPKSVELSKINASYLNGVLKIKLPKNKEDQLQPKKFIKIK